MKCTMLKCKLHRVTVTHSELNYEGSCGIDANLMDAAGVLEYEQIEIYNITNGERFSTYAIKAEAGSNIISINGAAAHKASPKDLIIIAAYSSLDGQELKTYKPKLVYVDGQNNITHTNTQIPVQEAG
ncbi:MAG: aspartate 1-decarboxylase [Candidatus Endonucleobacter sp. (ex Gigantidas childressi)]|nr:aspartate 1-decarboxylase [Candidatus Endonucleobacter sp. (ex Gigantidas childressi)]